MTLSDLGFGTAPDAGAAGADTVSGVHRGRIILAIAGFALCFAVISIRLVDLSLALKDKAENRTRLSSSTVLSRPDIVDRNGHVLATDIKIASLFADASKVLDVDEAIELLTPVLPDLNVEDLRRKLSSDKKFVWIKRELTPRQQAEIHNLGIPAFGFKSEIRRVYPTGRTASHVLGHVNIDNQGIAGMEKYVDSQKRNDITGALPSINPLAPVELSIDLRVQYALRDELNKAMEKHRAIGAAGIVMDVRTGEIVAMSSLPDYDPNDPSDALEQKRMNRVTAGVYELGSTFKTITTAMALDLGVATIDSKFDARAPIRVGRFKISDFHAKRRILSVPEIFMYSSNIGTAKMAIKVGIEGHKAFLKRLHMFERVKTELPESALPLWPRKWKLISTMTIAFGHGLSVTPLHLAAAGTAMVNGGLYIRPTLLKRDQIAAHSIAERVIRPETSRHMRDLLKLNVERGTATKARAKGYSVGGKTGTAEKAVNGGYSRSSLLTSFLATFPADQPQYVLLVVLDEPKGSKETHGYATAGWNAAPTTGQVIRRIAPMLRILPKLENNNPLGEESGEIN